MVCDVCAGSGRSSAANEQSQVVVETVTKATTTQTYAAARPLHDTDASKVKSKGAGQQKADVDKDATFSVDASHAGTFWLIRFSIWH